jgi:hypothetical protein
VLVGCVSFDSFPGTSAHGPWTYLFQFQPITTAAGPDYDVILGMAFCKHGCVFALTVVVLSPAAVRNVYLLINYGDFVDGTATKALPYVQLLSVTDSAAAHMDFVQTRLGGVDTTGMQVFSADRPVSSPDDVSSGRKDKQTRTIVIWSVVAGSLFLVSFAVAVYITLKRRRRRNFVTRPNFSTVDTGLSYDYTSYHPLQHAPPPGETHQVQGYHTDVGYASMYDPYAETTRAQVAPVHEEYHSVAADIRGT